MHRALIALLVVIAILIPVLLTTRQESSRPAIDTTEEAPRSQAPTASPFPTQVTTLPIAETAKTLNTPESSIEEDFSTINLLLSQYRRHLKTGNPVGDNAEITATLLGRNPKGLAYLPASASFIDSEGQLIDRWGTPYFFHAISGEQMQIHSAGPDRKLHTADDVVSDF